MGRTLLTGGTGFVGSHVARALVARGDELRLTVRERSRFDNLKDLEDEYQTVSCDLTDRRALRRALKGVDRVFHCAGATSLRPEDAEMLMQANVIATRTVLEECLRAGVERVVYTSTCAAFGPAPEGGTADETQIFTAGRLGLPYVNTKHEAEVEALRLAAQGLPLVCVNPCVVFGPGRGDRHGSSASIVRRFLLGRIPAYVDGGLNIVDAEDVAQGHLLADEKGGVGERYILGNRNYTHQRLFADLARLSGIEPPALRLSKGAALRLAELAEAAPGRPPITVSEVKMVSQWWTYKNAKAKRELGWKTSPHEDTLESTVAWYLDREGERLARSRRSQPVQYKMAAAAVSALGGITGRLRR